VVFQFGLNDDDDVDEWKEPPATEPRVSIAECEANLRAMIAVARERAKLSLMTTNPPHSTSRLKELYGKPSYDPESADGFDAPLLAKYSERIRSLAMELGMGLVDVRYAVDAFAAEPSHVFDELCT
jgi:hypothetical protein